MTDLAVSVAQKTVGIIGAIQKDIQQNAVKSELQSIVDLHLKRAEALMNDLDEMSSAEKAAAGKGFDAEVTAVRAMLSAVKEEKNKSQRDKLWDKYFKDSIEKTRDERDSLSSLLDSIQHTMLLAKDVAASKEGNKHWALKEKQEEERRAEERKEDRLREEAKTNLWTTIHNKSDRDFGVLAWGWEYNWWWIWKKTMNDYKLKPGDHLPIKPHPDPEKSVYNRNIMIFAYPKPGEPNGIEIERPWGHETIRGHMKEVIDIHKTTGRYVCIENQRNSYRLTGNEDAAQRT